MLTTNRDGLWVLQVLCGIEMIAPELGLRPHLPAVETADAAWKHPMASELLSAGILTPDGVVDGVVREWLTVLGRRDLALLMHIGTPASGSSSEQVLMARFDRWWVALERSGDVVRLSAMGEARSEESACRLVGAQVARLCGHLAPASFRPVTLAADELLAGVRTGQALRRLLVRRGVDADQLNVVTLAGDRGRSAQASLVAIQAGAQPHIDPGVMTIIDTPVGRLLCEQVTRDGGSWMVLRPGSPGAIGEAVRRALRRLPAGEQWYAHRKAV